MLEDSTVLGLLQFIGLSLPAVAIYLQVLYQTHTKFDEYQGDVIDRTSEFTDFQLAKSAGALLAISGLMLLLDILIRQPPTITPERIGIQILFWIDTFAIILIGVALISIVMSILMNEQISGDPSVFQAYKTAILSILPFSSKIREDDD